MSDPTRLAAGALVRCALRGEPARALPHLLVREPGGAERAVALPPELTVGRGAGAGLVLADDGASRLHLRLRLSEDGAVDAEDLGSKNGLRLNGRPVATGPASLRSGDELLVGATVLRFEDPLAGLEVAEERRPAPADQARADQARAAAAGRRGLHLLAVAAALLGLAALLLALA